eukprot:502479_1
MELESLAVALQCCECHDRVLHKIARSCRFRGALIFIIAVKLMGLFSDALFVMEAFKYRTGGEVLIFILSMQRVSHFCCMCNHGIRPSQSYLNWAKQSITLKAKKKSKQNNQNVDDLLAVYKALWYGSLFVWEDYLEKIYVSEDSGQITYYYIFAVVVEWCAGFFIWGASNKLLIESGCEHGTSAFEYKYAAFLIIIFVWTHYMGIIQHIIIIFNFDKSRFQYAPRQNVNNNIGVNTQQQIYQNNGQAVQVQMVPIQYAQQPVQYIQPQQPIYYAGQQPTIPSMRASRPEVPRDNGYNDESNYKAKCTICKILRAVISIILIGATVLIPIELIQTKFLKNLNYVYILQCRNYI